MVRHRPFTKGSYPEGAMPDMQPESEMQEAKIEFAKQAMAEVIEQMKTIEFRLTNVTKERDVALLEVKRLQDKLDVVAEMEEHDMNLSTGG